MSEEVGGRLIVAIEKYFGTVAGYRSGHARGVCYGATFTPSAEAARLSVAPHMQGQDVPAIVRFSNEPSNPHLPDSALDIAGMAIKFLLPDGRETDILAINLPVFFVREPLDFVDFFRARRPGPKNGRPVPIRMLRFLLLHPESLPAVIHAAKHEFRVPASRAETRYYGLHSYRWTDPGGRARFVRYELAPAAGERTITRAAAGRRGPDYLAEEMAQRLAAGLVEFRLILQVAGDGDAVDDPTRRWPKSRQLVDAGTLVVAGVAGDQDSDCEHRVFDPNRVIDGIAPSGDRVLAARSAAYSISIDRRLPAPHES